MDIKEKIKKFLVKQTEESKLTDQFFVTLRANLEQVKKSQKDLDDKFLEKISCIFDKKDKLWSDAYEIERLIIEMYNENMIDVELERRMVDAERELLDEEYKYYKSKIASFTEENNDKKERTAIDLKRTVLSRLINDLQWRNSINQTQRVHSIRIRNITSFIFILATILFFSSFTGLQSLNEYRLMVSLITGFWGASFSMIVSLNERLKQSNLEDLRLLRSFSFTFSRTVIGVGASLILYFFIYSGMLEGSIFPDLDALKNSSISNKIHFKNLSLLIIWSFIAGFSEKFVPNLLSKTEQRAKVVKV